MAKVIRKIGKPDSTDEALEKFNSGEWLVTNGIGGYASGTISGVITRRYHGLLTAAMPAPLGRMSMLAQLSEEIILPGGERVELISSEFLSLGMEGISAVHLTEFRLESGLPVWRYSFGGCLLEKRVFMPYRQNSVHIRYTLLEGSDINLNIRPSMNFRHHEAPVNTPLVEPYVLKSFEGKFEFYSGVPEVPPLKMLSYGEDTTFTVKGLNYCEVFYGVEESRGYEYSGELWSPGFFLFSLKKGTSATLIASTENWDMISAFTPDEAINAEAERRESLLIAAHDEAKMGFGAELALAADQFIIAPVGRPEDAARASAAGDEVRTVIAGYHWFTDWGRDTMISLEGLTLATGRQMEAGFILRTFSHYVRNGLIPNLFPEGNREGVYYTADASLWFFHAVDRYLENTGDYYTLQRILPRLSDIIDWHIKGTTYNIGVDPKDGLIRQGHPAHPLTWMDAKVGEWIVTPRRGKPVEINALWHNALKLMEKWIKKERGARQAVIYEELAEMSRRSFNERFWHEEGGYLYDVVDGESGDDTSLRPNQIFSISLHNPVLDRKRWDSVMDAVTEKLLTPVGLRSLSPDDPEYKSKYYGDIRSRDAAYHQGTVWGWLIGPYIDAWLKLHPEDRVGARRFIQGFEEHMEKACIGSISEVFDAESPYNPGGCIAQAWSIAEVLRCWIKTAPEPTSAPP